MAILATDKAAVGETAVRVSHLGLGGTALSGEAPAMQPELRTSGPEAIALIRRSLSLGISYFDTAPMYGSGESERRYGEALQGYPRDAFTISTKVGRILEPPSPAESGITWRFDFSREGVRHSLESSLERLGLDFVDIAFIHDPDGDILFRADSTDYFREALQQSAPALQDLRSQGLVRAFGVGMNQWEMELEFARTGLFDCFLLAGRYTLLDQTALDQFLPYCERHGISVIAGGPFNSGILAVGDSQDATFNYAAASPVVRERARRISEVCRAYSVPLRAAALQFILAHPAIASVIPGSRSIEEVEDNVAMVNLPIPPELWRDLKVQGLVPENAPTPG